MTTLKHQKTSVHPDGPDDKARPSDWNADHALTCASGVILGRDAATEGAVGELVVSPASRLANKVLDLTRQAAQLLQFDAFTANGTWTRHSDAKLVRVMVIGGGGSGASGVTGDSTATRDGGRPGTPGTVLDVWFLAADLSPTESVVVGASVTGGTATTSGYTSGKAGNPSAFGSRAVALGGTAGAPNGFGPTISGAAPVLGGTTRWPGEANEAGGWPWCPFHPAAGGTGAGLTTAGATVAAKQGGAGYGGGQSLFETITLTRYSGGGGAVGTAGTARSGDYHGCGDGGGGGGVGLAGGAGGAPGGGGGGGGASRSTSGAGGAGARGEVRVFQYG